jgi:Sugar kinases, ribokinase family
MRSLSFGEILWDIFSDSRCLGGAPLNVSGHFARLGVDSAIVSAVGDDELGGEALRMMAAEGIDTGFVSELAGVPTGITTVSLQNGIPSYAFNEPCAWDRIAVNSAAIKKIIATEWDVFCFGTLAQRSKESEKTLHEILENITTKEIFFDVNLRKEFYSREIIDYSILHSSIVKMNDEEWPVLAALLAPASVCEEASFCDWLVMKYKLRGVLVTKGKKGVSAYFDGKTRSQAPGNVPVMDTVGAGDSFSAAFLTAMLRGHPVSVALSLASALADYVVSHAGAMPAYDPEIRARLKAIIR